MLRVEDLSVEYRQGSRWHRAVEGVSFTLQAGEILAIAGESGSGKSTVAQALLGLGQQSARAAGGRVLFRGQDLLRLSPTALRRLRGRDIAFVPQNPATSLTPTMRIGAQIAEIFRYHRLDAPEGIDRRAAGLLESVGLPEPAAMLRRFPHQLSGGQRQRVLIAMALAGTPGLIILDEPTTGLDVTNQARILQLLRDLRGRISAAMVYVSHDLAALASIADRVAVMQLGRVVEEGRIGEVFVSPAHPYTRRLLAALPRMDRPPADAGAPMVADPAAAPLLAVADLAIRYPRRGGDVVAAEGVSFAIPPGETLALVGESGSGKSSVARVISGLQAPTDGTILLSGRPLPGLSRRRPAALKREIQLVFQNPDASLNPRHSVARILVRAIRACQPVSRAEAHARAAELIAAVRLDPAHLDRLPRQLSGGQRQRVAIARALAADPKLILCDEVLSALDVSVQAEILQLLRQLQRQHGIAILFISHDLAVVRWLAHQVAVMHRGRICQAGSAAEVFTPPCHPYTQSLIDAVPVVPGAAEPDVPSGQDRQDSAKPRRAECP
ncbi:MAG: ABC transporter ATP-binding protein [Rhodobacteraceae bacterium]|nr:ABC transporter ATP-binding protein [Paracoccaceae bacterium]